MILINGIDVIIFFDTVPYRILHTDFLSLIDEWDAAEKDTDGSEHFGSGRILCIIW